IEVRPGNSAIVHHVLLYEDTTNLIRLKDSADAGVGYTSFFGTGSSDSKLVGEWVPGTQHIKFPAGMGARLRKNTRLVLQIHYPKGTYLKLDSTRVNIKFATNTSSPLFREVFMLPAISEVNLKNGPLVIPPNMVKTFTATSLATTNLQLPFPYFTLLSVAPHMHLIGKSMKVFAIDNTPTKDTIPFINIPNWDFKWQGVYNFRNPIKVAVGSTLVALSAYDNTANNPSNPSNPPVTVHQGESTTDEMMLVFFAFTAYLPGDENIVVDNSPIVGINDLQNDIVNSLQMYNVFPNPAKTNAQLNYFSPKGQSQVKATITAIDGKVVKEWSTTLQQGYGSVQMNLEGLSKGQYFISLQTQSFTKTKPFIVYE
ncbi:MAG: T9SS type A sorting domain-containing protein, partial [Bacteroidota bacterium]